MQYTFEQESSQASTTLTHPTPKKKYTGKAIAAPPIQLMQLDAAPARRQAPIVQRLVDHNLTEITDIIAITKDVFSVSHSGRDIIIKFQGDLEGDTFADGALRAMGVAAPESKLVPAETLLAQLPAQGSGPGATEALRTKLMGMKDGNVLVANKLATNPLGPDAATASQDTIDILDNPRFAFDLGKVAAYDAVLGHQDRILGGINFGNMMFPTGNGINQIDNQMHDNGVWFHVLEMEDIFQSVIRNEQSRFAAHTSGIFEGLYRKQLNFAKFQEGFVMAMEQFLKMQGELNKYLRENAGGLADQLAVNAHRVTAQIETNAPFHKALSKIKMEKLEAKERARKEKEKIESQRGFRSRLKGLSAKKK
ncbi:MAG TPA: hypothetical protein ENJ82_14325 [Bacteroidetes bacterium]|nr:hypothetical protein [Bacteroidota bacterium]